MAEPTGAYTFEQLMTLVATEAGCAFYGTGGQEEAMCPVASRHDFLLIRGIVNRGVKLLQNTPPRGEGWKWRSKTMSITTVSGTSIYTLDQDFCGIPTGRPFWTADTASATRLEWVHESRIHDRRAVNVVQSWPTHAAIYRSNTLRRWELILDPEPNMIATLNFTYESIHDDLRMEGGTATGGGATTLIDTSLATYNYFADDFFNDWIITVLSGTGKGQTATVTDWDQATSTFTFTALSGGATPDTTTVYLVQPASNLHPAGAALDTAVLAACHAVAEVELTLDNGMESRFLNIALPAAFEINAQQKGRARNLGRMTNGPAHGPERIWNDIDTSAL